MKSKPTLPTALLTRRAAHRVLPLEARLMFDAAAATEATTAVIAADPAAPASPADGAVADSPRTAETTAARAVDLGASGLPLGAAPQQAVGHALEQVNATLGRLPGAPDYQDLLLQSFGSAGTEAGEFAQRAAELARAIEAGELRLQVELRSGAELQGAYAAYAARGPGGEERIYLNADWLNRGASEEAVARALLEEVGHALDHRLNAGADSRGDEGERFAALVRGETLSAFRLQALDADADHTTLTLDGERVDVEFAELSVPFPEGFIGTVGSNSNQANGVLNFATLGVTRASFFQDSSSGSFTAQGNDIPGGLRLTLSSGEVITVNGAINWRVTSGNNLYAFGFIPDPATPSRSFTYGASQTFTISATSNFGLELVGVSYSVNDNTNVGGNAATNGLLDALNTYLAQVQANDPNGPVTVNALSTSDTTPTLGGSATLGAGESLTVAVNGVTYTTSTGLTVGGGSWSLTIPNGNALTAGSTYSVTATITNSSGYTLTDSSSGELVIVAPDVTAPVVTAGQSFSYAENRASGTALGTVAATDAVGVTGYRFSATGTSTSADGFYSINGSGQISLTTAGAAAGAASNDHETTPNSFSYGIEAGDAAGNWSSAVNVSLQVTDVDDTAPVVTASQSFSYAENRASGAVLGTVAATDAVGVTGYRFSATGTGTSADGYYSIANNGQISLTAAGAAAGAASNDFETGPNSFAHGVQARDAAGNWSSAVSVSLDVTDVDDSAPVVTAGQSFSYAENQASGTVLGTVAATDAVGVTDYRFSATGTGTSADGHYSIDNSGQISLTAAGAAAGAATNDFETSPNSFSHGVQARDTAGNWSAAVNVTLAVTDVNEVVVDGTAPVVAAGQSFGYAENQVGGAVLGTVQASDAVGVTAFRFSATGTSTSADGWFSLANNGQISLTAAGAAAGVAANDHETAPNSFTHGVQAADAAGNWSNAVNVVLQVTDVDDTAPVVASGQSFSYAENRTSGAVLGTVAASDAVGVTGYRFAATGTSTSADGYFSLANNGQISLTAAGAAAGVAANDFETAPNSFTHAVQARDAAGQWSGAVDVVLAVTDVDDSAPVMTAGQSLSYAENQAPGAVLGTVTANDAVGVTGYRFSATGTGTSADGWFSIADNGQISLTAAGAAAGIAANDHETTPNGFTHGVQARDAAGNWSGAADVVLAVTDVDDTAPVVMPGQSFSYAENRAGGTVVGTVAANDAAGVTGYRFSATGTATSADCFFSVDAQGQIRLTAAGAEAGAAANDYETGPNSFTHAVQARDAAGNWSAAVGVTLQLSDVAETTPDTAQALEDTPLTGNVLGNDLAPNPQVASFSVGGRSVSAGGTLVIDGVGCVSIAANGDFRFEPVADWHGSVPAITYVTDSGQSATLQLSITPQNDAPSLPPASLGTFQDVAWEGRLPAATDADGDTLRYALVQGPAHGTLTLADDGGYRYTPAPGYSGADRFQVEVSDGQGGMARVWVEVSVAPAPTIGLPAEHDLGVSNSDRNTSADVIALAGSGTPGQTLELYAPDGQRIATTVVDAQCRWSVTGIDLRATVGDAGAPAGAPGRYTFTLRAVLPDGAVSAPVALAVQRELPVAPVPAAPAPRPEPAPAPAPAPLAAPLPEPLPPLQPAFDSALRSGDGPGTAQLPASRVLYERSSDTLPFGARESNAADIYTRPSGFQIMVNPAPEPSLKLFRGLDDQMAKLGAPIQLQVPADTFVHTNVNETVALHATLADGRPLPRWLQFDGRSGALTGEVPAGWREDLVIRITARDSQGREATATMRLKLGAGERAGLGEGFSRQLMQGHGAPRALAARA